MKKEFLRTVAAIVSAFTLLSFAVGCKKNNDSESISGSSGEPTSESTAPGGDIISKLDDSEIKGTIDYTKRKKVVAKSGINLIENGKSDYVILIPAEADANIASASKELSEFLFSSSGVRLTVVRDDIYAGGDKFISLGKTTRFAESGITLTEETGQTGYILKRIGNSLYINGNKSFGVVDGVYDMLSYTIDYECYASDEVYVAEMSAVPLLDFDEKFKPNVDVRTHNLKEIREDKIYRQRMRLQDASESWIAKGHTTIGNFLPLDDYLKDHPEWYGTTGGKQICFASGLRENNDLYGMRAELVKRMEELIEAVKTRDNIQIGIEDNWVQCECDLCVAAKAKYGNYAGLQLEFTNQCAEDIDEWLSVNYPEREINYSFFAYQQCQEAPAKLDEATGKYVPVSEYFRVKENVSVFFCPISTDFSKPLTKEDNEANYTLLKKWSDLFIGADRRENIMIWTYSLAAFSYFIPLDSFGSVGETYRIYSEMGVFDVYDQASGDSNTASFQALKVYTQTKLMYDTSYEYNELVDDFITHYYGQAHAEIKEFYDYLRSYYEYLEQTQGISGYIFFKYTSQDYWPSSVLDKMIDMLDKALEKIQPLKSSDPARFEVLDARIRRERLFPIYLKFTFYMGEITQEKKEEYYYDMEKLTAKFGIMGTQEAAWNIESLLSEWRSVIFG